ncbi:MAG: hypothetical protein IKA84_01015 [Clostridia bacterium]|nr:hypothetical protein [Clostridia bacterium]
MIKFIAKLLLLILIISLCFNLVGCKIFQSKVRAINSSFYVTIEAPKSDDGVDFEIANMYDLVITPLVGHVDEYNSELITIEYNKENMVIETTSTKTIFSPSLIYSIYIYDFGEDDTLKFTYNGETVEINYDVVDYDFDSRGWTVPTSIYELDAFPEFKEMLFSIKYHEFKEPYIGLTSYSYSNYWDMGSWGYFLGHDYHTDYLEYLTDSVYYPSVFNVGEQNHTPNLGAGMSFRGSEHVCAGAGRSVMESFSVSYGYVVDPGCTKPQYQYPLTSMSFSARNKELYKEISNPMEKDYPSVSQILVTNYPDKFFVFELNGLTIYFNTDKNRSANAYFFDEHYFYSLKCCYNR